MSFRLSVTLPNQTYQSNVKLKRHYDGYLIRLEEMFATRNSIELEVLMKNKNYLVFERWYYSLGTAIMTAEMVL